MKNVRNTGNSNVVLIVLLDYSLIIWFCANNSIFYLSMNAICVANIPYIYMIWYLYIHMGHHRAYKHVHLSSIPTHWPSQGHEHEDWQLFVQSRGPGMDRRLRLGSSSQEPIRPWLLVFGFFTFWEGCSWFCFKGGYHVRLLVLFVSQVLHGDNLVCFQFGL